MSSTDQRNKCIAHALPLPFFSHISHFICLIVSLSKRVADEGVYLYGLSVPIARMRCDSTTARAMGSTNGEWCET